MRWGGFGQPWFGSGTYLRAISLNGLIEPRGPTDKPFIKDIQRALPNSRNPQ